ncbi:hypothetical protein AMECASPLE_032075 [Ameca splendens]|uniref:Uncharacterized protein n=1 Tax=Ameca splendens TaxID=208324 RepID=A0ABV0ZSK6_9TELE
MHIIFLQECSLYFTCSRLRPGGNTSSRRKPGQSSIKRHLSAHSGGIQRSSQAKKRYRNNPENPGSAPGFPSVGHVCKTSKESRHPEMFSDAQKPPADSR